jgi:hypothetical protein
MGFWLRENKSHSKISAAPFRFTIGRRTYSESVENYKSASVLEDQREERVKLKQSEFFQKGTLSGTSTKGL